MTSMLTGLAWYFGVALALYAAVCAASRMEKRT